MCAVRLLILEADSLFMHNSSLKLCSVDLAGNGEVIIQLVSKVTRRGSLMRMSKQLMDLVYRLCNPEYI